MENVKMNMSFHGFKNTGAQNIGQFYLNKHVATYTMLNCELKNDRLGFDLDTFQKEFKDFLNPINFNFFNILMCENINSTTKFKINDKICEINDKNLKIYTFAAKILKEIINAPKEYFKISNDYIGSEDFEQTYLLDEKYRNEIISSIFKIKNIKQLAAKLLDSITKEIDDYLS